MAEKEGGTAYHHQMILEAAIQQRLTQYPERFFELAQIQHVGSIPANILNPSFHHSANRFAAAVAIVDLACREDLSSSGRIDAQITYSASELRHVIEAVRSGETVAVFEQRRGADAAGLEIKR